MHTVNIRVTHKKADIPTIEAITFPDPKKIMRELKKLSSVKECVILQTCNRVEIFAAVDDVGRAHHEISGFIMSAGISNVRENIKKKKPDMSPEELLEEVNVISKNIHTAIEEVHHSEALLHLLRLTSGLESMIVGEDQILGQIKDAFADAKEICAVGPFFKNIFGKAINVGKRARKETKINNGAVSVGSAGVQLAESHFGTLTGKNVIIIGAGEMGQLVAKALCDKDIDMIFVANRTYEKGIELAEKLGGVVLKFEDVGKGIRNSDVLITATGAPRTIIHKETIEEAFEKREKGELVIIDLGTPRNVDEDVEGLPGVKLLNIDGLRAIAEENKRIREKEAERVQEIIEEEMALLEKQLYHVDVDDIVKSVFEMAEEVRVKEFRRAMKKLGSKLDDRDRKIIDDMTAAIVKKTMSPIAEKVRKAAERGDEVTVQVGKTYFMDETSIGKKKKEAKDVPS